MKFREHSMTSDMQAIEVSHLVKQFGAFTAVNDISFSVAVGETFGFLGPNGAGKTTTIRMLTGISPPTSGMATIFGHDIVRDTVAARQSNTPSVEIPFPTPIQASKDPVARKSLSTISSSGSPTGTTSTSPCLI